jgi:hypothetical protein
VDQKSKKTRLQRIYSPADEERILDAASKDLHVSRADLVLIRETGGFLVKNTATQECWEVGLMNSLPEIEPAN